MKDSLILQKKKKSMAVFQELSIYYKPQESADFVQQHALPCSCRSKERLLQGKTGFPSQGNASPPLPELHYRQTS